MVLLSRIQESPPTKTCVTVEYKMHTELTTPLVEGTNYSNSSAAIDDSTVSLPTNATPTAQPSCIGISSSSSAAATQRQFTKRHTPTNASYKQLLMANTRKDTRFMHVRYRTSACSTLHTTPTLDVEEQRNAVVCTNVIESLKENDGDNPFGALLNAAVLLTGALAVAGSLMFGATALQAHFDLLGKEKGENNETADFVVRRATPLALKKH